METNSNFSNNNDFRIYSSKYPKLDEYVVVVFTNQEEAHFDGQLIEYGDLPVIMSYSDATRKSKVYVWNKIVPLNKKMLARIEEVNGNLIRVSIAYNPKFKEGEDGLLFYNQNESLISLIKKICINNNIEFNKFWIDVMHEIDKKRIEESEENLYEYFNNNLSYYEEIIKSKYENFENIIKSTHGYIIKKVYKILSRVGIISMTGITKTKDMFKQLTEENNDWEYKIKYDTTPFFIIESFSNNSSNDNHEKLVTNLNNLSKEYKLFTKVEYIGKKQES
jgi:translation initiation factor 2 alpha subunit (eIF-2alpha)